MTVPAVPITTSEISRFCSQLRGVPVLWGEIVEVDLTTTPKRVYHSLGYRPKGYIPVALDAAAIVYGSIDDKYLTLSASATVRASLWVF